MELNRQYNTISAFSFAALTINCSYKLSLGHCILECNSYDNTTLCVHYARFFSNITCNECIQFAQNNIKCTQFVFVFITTYMRKTYLSPTNNRMAYRFPIRHPFIADGDGAAGANKIVRMQTMYSVE